MRLPLSRRTFLRAAGGALRDPLSSERALLPVGVGGPALSIHERQPADRPSERRSNEARRSGSTNGATIWQPAWWTDSRGVTPHTGVERRGGEFHHDGGGGRTVATARRRLRRVLPDDRRTSRARGGRGLLLPFTHELLPEPEEPVAVLPGGSGPFYDAGQRYSVPYTVYSTGIGWRRDLVRDGDSPAYLENPYDAFWNERYRGAVGIYDDYREAIAMALIRRGEDPNTGEVTSRSTRAVDDLVALAEAVDVEISAEGAYEELQTGEYAVQQAWSGDMLSATRFGAVRRSTMTASSPTRGLAAASSAATSRRSARRDATPPSRMRSSTISWTCGWRSRISAGTAISHRSATNRRWFPRTSTMRSSTPRDLTEGRFLRPLGPEADARWRVGWQRVPRGPYSA